MEVDDFKGVIYVVLHLDLLQKAGPNRWTVKMIVRVSVAGMAGPGAWPRELERMVPCEHRHPVLADDDVSKVLWVERRSAVVHDELHGLFAAREEKRGQQDVRVCASSRVHEGDAGGPLCECPPSGVEL